MTVLDETAAAVTAPRWADVGPEQAVTVDRGVCALVGARAVAVFRCAGAPGEPERWFAVDNVDPFTGASVLSRGIVGSVDDRAMVVSPLLKQRFDLATGVCLDDGEVRLSVWPVRVVEGRVLVGTEASSSGNDRETTSKHGPATIRR